MTDSYPHAASEVSEPKWRQFARLMASTGVVVGVGDELEVTASGTNRVLTIGTGRAYVDGFLYDQPDPVTLDPGIAHASSDRIDTVVVRYDPEGDAIISGLVRLAIVAGTPASSPVPAALTQDPDGVFETPLAYVRVVGGSSVIGAGQIEDMRTAAQRLNLAGYDEQIAAINPVSGATVLNLGAGSVQTATIVGPTTITLGGLPPAGTARTVMFRLLQDAVGSHVVTWPAGWTWFADEPQPSEWVDDRVVLVVITAHGSTAVDAHVSVGEVL